MSRYHLPPMIIDFTIAAYICNRYFPDNSVTGLPAFLLAITNLLFVAFAIIHIAIMYDHTITNRNFQTVPLKFSQFEKFYYLKEIRYNMDDALSVIYNTWDMCYDHDSFILTGEVQKPHTFYIYFKSLFDYMRYWKFRHDAKYGGKQEERTEAYLKFVKEDLKDFEKRSEEEMRDALEEIKKTRPKNENEDGSFFI